MYSKVSAAGQVEATVVRYVVMEINLVLKYLEHKRVQPEEPCGGFRLAIGPYKTVRATKTDQPRVACPKARRTRSAPRAVGQGSADEGKGRT